jgi:hypothetical protein
VRYSFRIPVLTVTCALAFAALAAANDKEVANLYHEAGLKAMNSGDTEKAAEQFRKALQRYPVHVDALVDFGRLLTDELDAGGLVELYESWLKAYRNLSAPTKEQVEVAQKIGKSLEDLKDIERIDRTFSRKFAALARSLKRKDKDTAVEAYNIALTLDPKNSGAAREYAKLTGEDAKPSGKSKSGKLAGVKLGKMLMSEEFSKTNTDWFMKTGMAYMEKGKYVVISDEKPTLARYHYAFKPKDFYVETEIRLGGRADEHTAGGLCFRVMENNDFYVFYISPRGRYGAWAVQNGHKKDLTGKEGSNSPPGRFACGAVSKYVKKGNAKNHIAVGFVGSSFFCYVNGHLVFKCEDNSIAEGGTIGCSVNGGNHTFAFDNYKVHEATLAK